VFLCPVES
jgi:hypothetical protein